MDDTIIYPISWGTILLIILIPIMAVIGGIQMTMDFIYENLFTIIFIVSAISLILSIIPTITNKSIIFLLSGIIITSQFIFYLYMGYYAIEPYIQSSYFEYLWGMILFVLWIAYGIINLCATYFALGLTCIAFRHRTEDKSAKIFGEWICSGIGAVGWIINFFIFVVF